MNKVKSRQDADTSNKNQSPIAFYVLMALLALSFVAIFSMLFVF